MALTSSFQAREFYKRPADKRVYAANPDFVYNLGPPTVQAMTEWPVDDIVKLRDADTTNYLGTKQTHSLSDGSGLCEKLGTTY